MFTLRDQSPRRLVFIGGGAGMAPILCLLRSLQERGIERDAVYYYGAREETDLFRREELEALAGERRPSATCPRCPTREWDGEAGMITDVVERLEEDLKDVDAYVCGPPPMVEAAQGAADGQGRPRVAHLFRQVHDHRDGGDESHMSTDTETPPKERSVPKPVFTDAEAGSQEFPSSTSRSYNYFTPAQAPRDDLRGRHRRRPARS